MRESVPKGADFFVRILANVDFFAILRQYMHAAASRIPCSPQSVVPGEKFIQKNLAVSDFFLTFVSENKTKNIMEMQKREIERIAIIDHDNHRLMIEDVDMDLVNRSYNGEEEAYILDNYELGEHWTWEWVTVTEYFPVEDGDPIEVEFTELL